jgi:hypothetical protein
MAEKALTENDAKALLQKRIAELEEANTRLEESNAEMRLTTSHSGDAVTVVRRELDEEIENYKRLSLMNTRLANEHNEARRTTVTAIWREN